MAAGHRLTAQAASDVLRDGGNAVDAAIAAVWMACVCEPVLAAPCGGGFAMIRDARGNVELTDFFTQTPLRKNPAASGFREVHADFGTTTQAFHIGDASTATPGLVPGLFDLQHRFGSRPMHSLTAPSVSAASSGITVTTYQHRLATIVAPILSATEASRAIFAPGGQVIPAGQTFHNPDLAGFLNAVGAGDLAAYRDLAPAALVPTGPARGHLGKDDFDRYRVERRLPLGVSFYGMDVSLNPAPSAGGTLIAHTLDAMAGLSPVDFARALDRTDRQRRDLQSPLARKLATFGTPGYRGTTHVSVVDADGMACAITVSNGEGNGEIAGSLGFMPNNMLGEEDVNPSGALGWSENIRLSSMMCPMIASSRDLGIVALGSGGSNRIRSALAQVLCGLARQSGSLEDILNGPRLHVERGHLDAEAHFSQDTLATLSEEFVDHLVWPEPNMFFGGCHAVMRRPDGSFHAAGDPRRDGFALIVS